jgi:hypothetical protein
MRPRSAANLKTIVEAAKPLYMSLGGVQKHARTNAGARARALCDGDETSSHDRGRSGRRRVVVAQRGQPWAGGDACRSLGWVLARRRQRQYGLTSCCRCSNPRSRSPDRESHRQRSLAATSDGAPFNEKGLTVDLQMTSPLLILAAGRRPARRGRLSDDVSPRRRKG